MKRRIITSVLVFGMALSLAACSGNSGTKTANNSNGTSVNESNSSTDNSSDGDKASSGDSADSSGDGKDKKNNSGDEVQLLPFSVNVDRYTNNVFNKHINDFIFSAKREYIRLENENNSLCNSINAKFEKERYDDNNTTEKLIKQVKKDKKKDYLDDKKILIKRADTVVLSYVNCCTTYSGGAHGSYLRIGYNYDSASGKELKIKDICKDAEGLEKSIREKLKKKYKKSKPKFLDDFFAEVKKEKPEYDYNYYIGYDGVTFIFNPLDIDTYAGGSYNVTVPFDEGLFDMRFSKTPKDYIVGMSFGEDVNCDFDKDGKKDTLVVYKKKEKNGDGIESVDIIINNKKTNQEIHAYDAKIYYVHRENTKDCIYVITSIENDYQEIYVFSIDGKKVVSAGKPMSKMLRSYFAKRVDTNGKKIEYEREFIPINPDSLYLSDRTDLLSSYNVYGEYSIDDKGLPRAKENYYKVDEKSAYQITLTTKTTLPLKVVNGENGQETGEKYEVKKNEKLVICATNLKNFVDFKTENGKIVRAKVDVNSDKYKNGQGIDGNDIGMVFQQLYFAG